MNCSGCGLDFVRAQGPYPELCRPCAGEYRRVHMANWRTARLGFVSTLTLPEWLSILQHYRHRCAYCGGPFEVLDHASGLKAGSTSANCRPACCRCNWAKGDNPAFVGTAPKTPVKHQAQRKENAYARLWARWVAFGAEWTGSGVVAFAQAQLERGVSNVSVLQYVLAVNRLAQERGLPSLRQDPAVVELCNMLR